MGTSTPAPTNPGTGASRPSSRNSAEEIFRLTRAREPALSRLLMAYITTGLFFMLFPGTLLGVWDLLQISARESAGLISTAWLQAHGHAQVFGWIGSFLLGIGFMRFRSCAAKRHKLSARLGFAGRFGPPVWRCGGARRCTCGTGACCCRCRAFWNWRRS